MKNYQECLVYRHTSPSGKVYIGITNDYSFRCIQHQSSTRTGSTFAFHRAIRKYGWENFKHEILTTDLTRQQAADMEVALIAAYPPDQTYNMTLGGEGYSGGNVDGATIRKGYLANRNVKDVKGYVYSKRDNKYQIVLSYLGESLYFGQFKLESDAKVRADYIMSLTDEELVQVAEEYKGKKIDRTKGYYFNKKMNKYQVQLSIDGKVQSFGSYTDEQDATNKVNEVRNELGGVLSRTIKN